MSVCFCSSFSAHNFLSRIINCLGGKEGITGAACMLELFLLVPTQSFVIREVGLPHNCCVPISHYKLIVYGIIYLYDGPCCFIGHAGSFGDGNVGGPPL